MTKYKKDKIHDNLKKSNAWLGCAKKDRRQAGYALRAEGNSAK